MDDTAVEMPDIPQILQDAESTSPGNVPSLSAPRGRGRSPRATATGGPSAPKGATSTQRSAAKNDIKSSWKGLWEALATAYDDPELAMTEPELEQFAEPATRTLEMLGQLEQTKKLAPASLAGVTFAQVRPRVQRMALKTPKRSKKSPPPAFTPAANGNMPAPEGPPPFNPAIGLGYDRPERI